MSNSGWRLITINMIFNPGSVVYHGFFSFWLASNEKMILTPLSVFYAICKKVPSQFSSPIGKSQRYEKTLYSPDGHVALLPESWLRIVSWSTDSEPKNNDPRK